MPTQPAHAMREVQLPDGSIVNAYELDVTLQVCCLPVSAPCIPWRVSQ